MALSHTREKPRDSSEELAHAFSSLRNFFGFCLPVLASTLAHYFTIFLATYWMSVLGSTELAAGSLGLSLWFFVYCFGLGSSSGIGPVMALAAGKGESERIVEVFHNGIILITLISGVSIAFLFLIRASLPYFIKPTLVVPTQEFLAAFSWSIWPCSTLSSIRQFFHALNTPSRGTFWTVVAALLTWIIGSALIYGWFGLPRLGLTGIGVAHTAGVGLAALLSLASIYRLPFYRRSAGRWRDNLNKPMLTYLARLSCPAGVGLLLTAVFDPVSTLITGSLSSIELAACGVADRCYTLAAMIGTALCYATTIQVSYILGSQGAEAGKKAFQQSLRVALSISLILGGSMVLFPQVWVSFFLSTHEPALELIQQRTIALMPLISIVQLVGNLHFTTVGGLRGLHDTFYSMITVGLCYWGIGITAMYGLTFYAGLGGDGVWYGLILCTAISLFFLLVRFFSLTEKISRGSLSLQKVA